MLHSIFTSKTRKYSGKSFSIYVAVLLLLGGLCVSPAGADEAANDYTEFSLEELMDMDVVYGASKYEQKVSEAPSAVTVITADEIRAFGYQSLAELLSSVGGYYVTSDRNYSYSGIRGFGRPGDYNTRLLVQIDGHRVNDSIYSSAGIGNDSPVEIANIERVEIIRGPNSSLYGTSALFGLVNIVTKDGAVGDGTQVSGSMESYSGYLGRLSYGTETESGLQFMFSGSARDVAGQDLYYSEFDDPSTNFGLSEGNDHASRENLFSKVKYGNWTLSGMYNARDKAVPTAAYEVVFNDHDAAAQDKQGYLDLSHDSRLSSGYDLNVRFFYDFYDYDERYLYNWAEEGDPADLVASEDKARGRWLGTEWRLSGELGTWNRIVTGLEYVSSFQQDQAYYDVDPYWSYLDDNRSAYSWAAYGQDEIIVNESLLLNLSVRHDYLQNIGGTTSPRLALIASLQENSVVKLLYGEAFRAPNLYELYYNDGEDGSMKSNPDLQPEKMASTEIIWEYTYGPRLKSSVSAYSYSIDNLITSVTDPADDLIVFRNVDKIEASGIEFELDARMQAGYKWRASYAFQRATDATTDRSLSNSPEHLVKLNLRTPPLWQGLSGGVELQYMSERYALSGDLIAPNTLTNITVLSNDWWGGLEVDASVYNLFDVAYGDPGSEEHAQDVLMRDGRNFRVQFRYRY